MSAELVHASVQKGLRGGSGFGTAVVTRGLAAPLERALEELSAYDFDPARAVGADRVEWAHRVLTVQGRSHSVLSRTAPCGSDWSGRPNRVAHHVVVDTAERAEAGPAWMLAALAQGVLMQHVPEVGERAQGPRLPGGALSARPAHAWSAVGFDPGWAGVVARALLDHAGAPCYLVLPGETDTLPLVEDVFALLPEDRRWHVTFSTRFLRSSPSARCQLRCVRAGAAGLRAMLAEPGARVITVETGVPAANQPGADAARTGAPIEAVLRMNTRVQPVLRSGDASRAAPEPRGASVTRFVPTERVAGLSSPTDGEARAPSALGSARAPWDADHRSVASRIGVGSSDFLAYILFGIAAMALLASLVLGVVILMRD
jgi:hypothetical protein